MKCPVCWKPVGLSNHGVVMRHREGCGRNCPMSGHEHPNAYEKQAAYASFERQLDRLGLRETA